MFLSHVGNGDKQFGMLDCNAEVCFMFINVVTVGSEPVVCTKPLGGAVHAWDSVRTHH